MAYPNFVRGLSSWKRETKQYNYCPKFGNSNAKLGCVQIFSFSADKEKKSERKSLGPNFFSYTKLTECFVSPLFKRVEMFNLYESDKGCYGQISSLIASCKSVSFRFSYKHQPLWVRRKRRKFHSFLQLLASTWNFTSHISQRKYLPWKPSEKCGEFRIENTFL